MSSAATISSPTFRRCRRASLRVRKVGRAGSLDRQSVGVIARSLISRSHSRELALECGYNAASIRERIYSDSGLADEIGSLVDECFRTAVEQFDSAAKILKARRRRDSDRYRSRANA